MEAEVHDIFSKIIQHLNQCQQVADVKRYLFELIKCIHHSASGSIKQWETVSRRVTNQASTQLHTLTFEKSKITVTYHYLFDLSSYATILLELTKGSAKRQLTIRKALFLYDCKLQRILELDSEAA